MVIIKKIIEYVRRPFVYFYLVVSRKPIFISLVVILLFVGVVTVPILINLNNVRDKTNQIQDNIDQDYDYDGVNDSQTNNVETNLDVQESALVNYYYLLDEKIFVKGYTLFTNMSSTISGIQYKQVHPKLVNYLSKYAVLGVNVPKGYQYPIIGTSECSDGDICFTYTEVTVVWKNNGISGVGSGVLLAPIDEFDERNGQLLDTGEVVSNGSNNSSQNNSTDINTSNGDTSNNANTTNNGSSNNTNNESNSTNTKSARDIDKERLNSVNIVLNESKGKVVISFKPRVNDTDIIYIDGKSFSADDVDLSNTIYTYTSSGKNCFQVKIVNKYGDEKVFNESVTFNPIAPNYEVLLWNLAPSGTCEFSVTTKDTNVYNLNDLKCTIDGTNVDCGDRFEYSGGKGFKIYKDLGHHSLTITNKYGLSQNLDLDCSR